MIRDPIVEEIHRIRRKMLEECGGDFDKLFERWKATEAADRPRHTPRTTHKRRPAAAAK